MSRSTLRTAFFLVLTFSSATLWAKFPVVVAVRYTDSNGRVFDSKGTVQKQSDGQYKVTFSGKDGRFRSVLTDEGSLLEYQRVGEFVQANPQQTPKVPRTTGGFSPGKYDSAVLDVKAGDFTRSVEGVGVRVRIEDFQRSGDAHGDPIMSVAGRFETHGYVKTLPLAGWNGDVPVFDGSPGGYEFPSLETVDLRKQRFLLDFGKSPFDGGKQLLYPVYVDRYEGENAVLIAPHELQRLERAKAGERIKVAYWEVPKAFLRVAGEGKEGDALLQNARLQFVDDQGKLAATNRPIETIIRANRHAADRLVEVVTGRNLSDTMNGMRTEMLRVQAAEPGANCPPNLSRLSGSGSGTVGSR